MIILTVTGLLFYLMAAAFVVCGVLAIRLGWGLMKFIGTCFLLELALVVLLVIL